MASYRRMIAGVIHPCAWAVLVTMAACGSDGLTFLDASSQDDDAAAPDAPIDGAVDAGPVVLTATDDFAPGLGSLCGIGYDPVDAEVWIYPCSGADLHGYAVTGEALDTLARPGESADDGDVSFSATAFELGSNHVPAGALMFINGESGVADLYLPDVSNSTSLATAFGASHVVGGSYHPTRATVFLVQDQVASTQPNTVAELDPVTGAVESSFSTAELFTVHYGDLEVCPSSGHLLLVSSVESTLLELTPSGALIAEHALPPALSAPSGIALAPEGRAWISTTEGEVWRVDGVPCSP